MQMDVIPALEEREWNERTEFPNGLSYSNQFFTLNPTLALPTDSLYLSDYIYKLTEDTELNRIEIK